MNPDVELQRLRMRLTHKRIPADFIDQIVDSAAQSLNETILDAVASTMTQAVEYADSIGAHEFAEEIDIAASGGIYRIITLSGRTDFSTPERKMRDSLLRGAKVSKDGTRYKVIPVGGKKAGSSVKSIFQDQKVRQDLIKAARESITTELAGSRSNRTGAMTDNFRNMLKSHSAMRKGFDKGSSAKSSMSSAATPQVFRTVTDKSPEDSWVAPAKDMDMTEFLMDLNNTLASHIITAVETIIRGYERIG